MFSEARNKACQKKADSNFETSTIRSFSYLREIYLLKNQEAQERRVLVVHLNVLVGCPGERKATSSGGGGDENIIIMATFIPVFYVAMLPPIA